MNVWAKLLLAGLGGMGIGAAAAFDSSPDYTALKPIRDRSTKWRSFVVEGLPN